MGTFSIIDKASSSNDVDNVEAVSSLNPKDNSETVAPPKSPDVTDAEDYDPHEHRNVSNPTT